MLAEGRGQLLIQSASRRQCQGRLPGGGDREVEGLSCEGQHGRPAGAEGQKAWSVWSSCRLGR